MKKETIIVAVMLFLSPSLLFGQRVEKLLNLAYKNSPLLKMQYYKTIEKENNFREESIFNKNPNMTFGYSNIPVSEWPSRDHHAMSGISIGINQFIAMPWESHYRKKYRYNLFLSEKEKYEDTKSRIALEIQTGYHSLMFLYKKRKVLLESKKVLSNILRLSESLVSVNKMNASQLLKIRADISGLENKIIELTGTIKKSESNIEKIAGAEISWNVKDEQINKWIQPDLQKFSSSIFDARNHPIFKSIYRVHGAKKAQHNLQWAKLSPGVTIGFEYRIREEIPGKDAGEDFISLKASIPIPLFYPIKDRHSINKRKAGEDSAKELLQEILNTLNAKWKGEREVEKNLYKAFHRQRNEVLPGYLAAYKSQMGSLSSGRIRLLDVLDTYRTYLSALIEEARLYKDLVSVRLKLHYLQSEYPGPKKEDENE